MMTLSMLCSAMALLPSSRTMSTTVSSLKLLSFYLIFIAFLGHVYAGQLDNACNGIKDAANCKAVFSIPTGAKLKTCKTQWFRTNPCKTVHKFTYPCPTFRKPFRKCPGSTCIPGTDAVYVDTPCGITVLTKKIDICQTVREQIPGFPNLLNKVLGTCKCLPEVIKLVDEKVLDALLDTADINGAAAVALQKYGKAQKCLADNSFTVQNNSQNLFQSGGALSELNGDIVFKAAEIDLASYISFAGALAPCFTPAGCNPDLIRSYFTEYLKRSEEIMSKQIVNLLNPWKNALVAIKNDFNNLKGDIKSITLEIQSIRAQVTKIIDDLCKDPKACADETLIKFRKKIEETFVFTETLNATQTSFNTIVKVVDEVESLVDNAKIAFEDLSDLGIADVVELVFNKKLTKLEQVADLLRAAKRLPTLLKSMSKSLSIVTSFIADLDMQGQKFGASLQMLISSSWSSDVQGDNVAAEKIKSAIQRIQSLVFDRTFSRIQKIVSRISSIGNNLQSVITSGASVKVGVASYKSFSNIQLDLPCSKLERIRYSLGGFSAVFDYPKFYRCNFETSVPFPNSHIPYVRISFSKTLKATFSLTDQASFAPTETAYDKVSSTDYPQSTTAVGTYTDSSPSTSATEALEGAGAKPASSSTGPSSLWSNKSSSELQSDVKSSPKSVRGPVVIVLSVVLPLVGLAACAAFLLCRTRRRARWNSAPFATIDPNRTHDAETRENVVYEPVSHEQS